MKTLLESAKLIENFILERGWSFCFIGGLAVQRWGRNRLTDEELYISELLKAFKGRRDDAAEFAMISRVVLLEDSSGIGIDISLGAMPFEEVAVARATSYEFLPGISLRTCSAEDLIVFKCFADRLQDWADVEGILEGHIDELDFIHIENQLTPLVELKEEPEIMEKYFKLVKGISKK